MSHIRANITYDHAYSAIHYSYSMCNAQSESYHSYLHKNIRKANLILLSLYSLYFQERKRQAKDADKEAKESDSKNRVALDAAALVSSGDGVIHLQGGIK